MIHKGKQVNIITIALRSSYEQLLASDKGFTQSLVSKLFTEERAKSTQEMEEKITIIQQISDKKVEQVVKEMEELRGISDKNVEQVVKEMKEMREEFDVRQKNQLKQKKLELKNILLNFVENLLNDE
jgi:hypothetical protein